MLNRPQKAWTQNKLVLLLELLAFCLEWEWQLRLWITSRALKREREKNALYQEAIRKHQAEINAFKNDREREEYKNRLWEELKARSEE